MTYVPIVDFHVDSESAIRNSVSLLVCEMYFVVYIHICVCARK
jgi:hypothetical protein